ncbi:MULTISPECIES: flagellar basal body L-ring protein FlgH [Sphingomonadales]|uniref:Flagellar L-ring protein n=2 Tax=Edaphosphingomonas TaxID=3423724 RepID=A0A2T4HPF1_9SPHN|nr:MULTISPECIES: flagellar basal body L-ring protein FlgH [Sphingomonas]AGH49094.1 flagellar L-ring protein FlgH [Sphingomonas sp. MM-1]MDX3883676.1 flagellar basal body L-ring protein FlgH [Sphingomonas sp.]OHT21515.1 Flagellar L-ring protein precursor [Sphingomonas haloaromaticamans]PTD17680.1 flagellar basal body L-ring protein FlgH [Sphingomonas fennica]
MKRIASALMIATLLSGCSVADRLANVGRAPKMSPMDDPTAPIIEPSLGNQAAAHRAGQASPPEPQPTGASLFRTGAGAFFRDQRASRVGDILTIRINIQDRASFDNSTARTRDGSENASLGRLFGLEPGNPELVGANSASKSTGSGNTTRSEQINMTMAALVTGVLPNGNLLIRGRQEMRVNFELRELIVSGVVRPEDIARDNSIAHSKIAEARISYGGRGQLTDAQQARWGQQIYDALFPF